MYQKRNIIVLLLVSAILSAYITSFFYNRKITFSEMPKIAILNGMKLKETAKCFDLHSEIEKKHTEILHDLHNEEKKIKKEFQSITHSKTLNAQKKQLQLLNLEHTWKKIVQQYDNKIQNIKNIDNKLTNSIQSALGKVLKKVAKKKSLSIILNKETEQATFVFFNKLNIDITDLVIEELNNELKNLTLKSLE